MKDFWQKLPNKGQPPNSGHRSMYQLVLYLEVPLYSTLFTCNYCNLLEWAWKNLLADYGYFYKFSHVHVTFTHSQFDTLSLSLFLLECFLTTSIPVYSCLFGFLSHQSCNPLEMNEDRQNSGLQIGWSMRRLSCNVEISLLSPLGMAENVEEGGYQGSVCIFSMNVPDCYSDLLNSCRHLHRSGVQA